MLFRPKNSNYGADALAQLRLKYSLPFYKTYYCHLPRWVLLLPPT